LRRPAAPDCAERSALLDSGTNFGGNGTTNFALPNLQANVPLHVGSGPGLTPRTVGETGGVPQVTLNVTEMPAHTHAANCNSGAGTSYDPANAVSAGDAGGAREYAAASNVTMAANALAATGGGQSHSNLQPYLAVEFLHRAAGHLPPTQLTEARVMATPFLGELKLVAFDFAPMGWAFCNGQLLSIAQNTALFALLGTQYGGDGQTTFALPNLQGALPLGAGPGYTQGQAGGATAIQADARADAGAFARRHGLECAGDANGSDERCVGAGFRRERDVRGGGQRYHGSHCDRHPRFFGGAQQHAAVPGAETGSSLCRASFRAATETAAVGGVSLRKEGSEDEPFLIALYASTRETELARTLWTDAEKTAFLRSQFALQQAHYRTHYRDADFCIIEAEGRPIGRFYVHRGAQEIRLMELALLPRLARTRHRRRVGADPGSGGDGGKLAGDLARRAEQPGPPALSSGRVPAHGRARLLRAPGLAAAGSSR